MGMFSCENDFHGGFPQTAADALYSVTAPSPERLLLSAHASHVLPGRRVSQPHRRRSSLLPSPPFGRQGDNTLHGLLHYTALLMF